MDRLGKSIAFFSLAVISASAAYGNALTDGGFEASSSWQAYHGSVVVNSSSAGSWWVGGDGAGWMRQGAASYSSGGQYCAGAPDGYSQSAGLVQFAPAGPGADGVSVSFDYLLWLGESSTTMTYGVYGWSDGDTIDLTSAGPGPAATVILGPKTISSPQYAGDPTPHDEYSLETAAGLFNAGQFDYIGIWMRHNLDGGSFYMDDVNMELTPEPATLALLAAGLMGLVRRRRK